MTEEVSNQVDAFVTPGSLLKAARQDQGIPEREAADRLNFMPGYVAILERDDYEALRSPPFARGYVKAYGKLLGLDEMQLLDAFDRLRDSRDSGERKKVETRSLQLQHTGLGVVIGLAILCLLVLGLWLWQGDRTEPAGVPLSPRGEIQQPPPTVMAGET